MQHNIAVFQTFFSFTVVAIAAATDVWKGLIYNWLTLPAMIVGLALAAWHQGWTGLGLSILGILIGGGVLFIPFFLGGMGGGDVKLMAAIGAVMGPWFVSKTLVASILAGGVMCFTLIIIRGSLKATIVWYVKSLNAIFKTLLYRGVVLNFPESPKAGTAPFGVSICIGVVVAYYCDVLHWFLM